jgi:hypothetical protein
VDASTTETIKSGLQGIACDSGIGKTAADALKWLSHQHKQWLLVFDNADDLEINLQDWFPSCKHGNILITSRNPECCIHAPDSNYEVSGMKPEEASHLLLTCAMEPTPDADEARTLAFNCL